MSIKIISGHSIFNENAVVLSKKYNWKIETDFDPQPKDLYIVYGAHELAHHLLEIQFRKNNSYGYVILNSEQTHSQFMKNKYYLSLMKRNIVFDFNTLTADYLKESFQIKVLAYHYFEFMKFNQESEDRKYDITFIGTKSDKRTDIINSLKEKYPDLSFFVDMDWQHSASDKLTTVLQQSKIVLNIPYHENNALETHRINKAISCGCKVVSLPSCDDDANDFYKDYVTFAADMLEVDFNNLEEKRTYEELIKSLTQKISGHFLFMIEHIHKKLLSINNKDEPANEVICEPTPADTDDTADQAEEIVLGEQVGERVSVC